VFAGFVSTVMTYVSLYLPQYHLPRWILIAIAIAAFLFAPVRLYIEQEKRIAELGTRIEQPRRAQLILRAEGGLFIIIANQYSHSERRAAGLYVELRFAVENKGQRTSTIESYDIRFPVTLEIRSSEHIKPNPVTQVSGLNATHMVGAIDDFVGGYIEVLPERVAGPVRVPFMIYSELPDLTKLMGLKCEVTVHDTEGNSASALFLLNHRG
jgi:hypothetical protein